MAGALQISGVKRLLQQQVSQSVPFSSLLRDIRKLDDPFVRQTFERPDDPMGLFNEMMNQAKSQLPGFSKDLPPRRNMFGDPIHYPPGFGPDILSPIAVMQVNPNDTVANELSRLQMAGPIAFETPPPGQEHLVLRMPDRNIRWQNRRGLNAIRRLDAVEYDEFVKLSAGMGLKQYPSGFDRMTLKQALKKEISRGYPNAGGLKSDEAKKIVLKEIVAAYRKAAKLQMLSENKNIRDSIEAQLNKRVDTILDRDREDLTDESF